MGVLSDIFIIEIGNTKIKQDIKNKGKVKNCKIESKILSSHNVLNRSVNAKNIKGFNQQVKQQQETKIGKKFTLHTCK